jgi:hypothetical protein
MEEVLAGLGERVFLLHNVHENQPVTFQTRWALSYLGGPMTREQIKTLTAEKKPEVSTDPAGVPLIEPTALAKAAEPIQSRTEPPQGPPEIDTYFLNASGAGQGLVYYPAVIGRMDVHFSNARYKVDTTETLAYLSAFEDGPVVLDWDNAVEFDPTTIDTAPLSGATYAELPTVAKKASTYRKWHKDLLRWVRQNRPLTLFRSKRFKMTSQMGESEGEFRGRLGQAVREKRDLEIEKLRRKYSSRFTTLRDRLMRSQQAIDREAEQAKSRKIQTAISFGTAILGAFLGRKTVSVGSASRVGSAMRSASRIRKDTMDVARAQERSAAIEAQLADLETRMQTDIEKIEFSFDPQFEELEEISVKAKSTDITLEIYGLAWVPYRKSVDGRLGPDWS